MEKQQNVFKCPFLGEMIMDYCEAYPVRKAIPKHQINTPSPCTGEGHRTCAVFIEIMARIQACATECKRDGRATLSLGRR